MLANKKVGHWCWALSGEEAMTALVVGRALREKTPVDAKLKRRFAAMLEKQKKLLARNARRGSPLDLGPRWQLT
jgi:hypothetical protein